MASIKSLLRPIALLSVAFALAAAGAPQRTFAQTYACPPGYYFLAGYGCYPYGGYYYPPSYYRGLPPVYPYPVYPYVAPWGFSFRFGGGGHFDHDHGHGGGHGGHH